MFSWHKGIIKYLSLAIFFCLLNISSPLAGSLTPQLEQLIATDSPTKTIRVWIKILSVDTGSNKAKQIPDKAINSSIDQHKSMLEYLHNRYRLSQKSLVDSLMLLKTGGGVDYIYQYWIANVVEVSMSVGDLKHLAQHDDVELILSPTEITLISPEISNLSISPNEGDSISPNLTHISADQAWAAGFTGQGRLVCSFDTGIEGTHNALYQNWKGLDGDLSAAWFDPIYNESLPHSQGDDFITRNHGTHVLGVMVGQRDTSGQSIGVAPNAQWISAAVVNVGGTALLRAFEWVADPDGNPNTVSDLPDVINHSWGFEQNGSSGWELTCQNIFYEAIENVESLGIVNIFAAGNSGGYGSQTIANPAVRANDSLDCFAVGNLDTRNEPPIISPSSSLGPSDCNEGIKPNVVAPGTAILSSITGNGYAVMTGTSMAAPHLSGLVALLRQKNPGASVQQIKEAILASTSSDVSWSTLPNNTYGWGEINCMAALDALAPPEAKMLARVYDLQYDTIIPGNTVDATVVIECLGADINSVRGVISGSYDHLTILDSLIWFGNISQGETVRASDNIRVLISDSARAGEIISVDFSLLGSGLNLKTKLHFIVQSQLTREILTHNTNRINFSLSNFGMYGFGPGSAVPGPGVGFSFDGQNNDLWEAGLIIGTGESQISSAVHTHIYEPDNDFAVAPGGNMQVFEFDNSTREMSRCAFVDANAVNPTNIEITQQCYSELGLNSDMVKIQYILSNNITLPVNNLYLGLFLDWDIVAYEQNIGGFEVNEQFSWMAHYNNGQPQHYRGVKLIRGPLATVLTEKGNRLIYTSVDGGDGFLAAEKYQALISGFSTADTYRDRPGELFQLTVAGPFNLLPGEVDTATFALLAGFSFQEISDAAIRASVIPTSTENNPTNLLPAKFKLNQNYPNPFNVSTTISFEAPLNSNYHLTVYNMLGQQVNKWEGKSDDSYVNFIWDADQYASGIYFYELEIDSQAIKKKMILLK